MPWRSRRPSTTASARLVTVQPGYVGLDLNGPDSRALLEAIDRAMRSLAGDGRPQVLLCSTRIRLALRGLMERQFPQVEVLSYEEILPSITVQVHAQVEV